MAKKLTSAKAKKILHDKSVHGQPLTDKQRRFFGAIAGGAEPYKAESGGWLDKYDAPKAQNGIEGTMGGLTDKGFNYNGAWGGTMQTGGNLMPAMAGAVQTVPMAQLGDSVKPITMQLAMGGSLPGAVGFTYARTIDAAPANGPYAKKTKASAQDGKYVKNKIKNIDNKLQERFIDPYLEKTFAHAKKQGIDYGSHNGPLDAIRHAASASKVASSIPVVGLPLANILGVAHEISANRGSKKELLSDLYNNFVGSVIGSVPFISDDTRRKLVVDAQKSGILSTIDNTRREPPPLRDNMLMDALMRVRERDAKLTPAKVNFENGGSMKYYQEGLDFKPKTISQDGVRIDPMGYWNPENVGEPVIIPSNVITMEGVDQPLIGISDTGDIQYMEPGGEYEFEGESVLEMPVARGGVSVNNADAQPLKKLDQLLNFTNYNKPTRGGWLDKYK